MKWRDTSPVWTPQTIEVLKARLGTRCPRLPTDSALAGESGWCLLVEPDVRNQVFSLLGQSRHERGGLLLGEVFVHSSAVGHDQLPAPSHVIWITAEVASTQYEASSISLRMQSDIWTEARTRLSGEQRVIGWYHSHPDLGAFFSGTDEATQAAFFSHDYSLGWVIDPIRHQEAWFRGRHSIRVDPDNCLTLPQVEP